MAMKKRGRGLDFEHRFNTSRWAEDLLLEAINATGAFDCFRLGLSQTADDNRPELDDVTYKEPDLLIFDKGELSKSEVSFLSQNDLTQISVSRIAEDPRLSGLISRARCAIEVEFSPYRAAEMKGRDWQVRSKDATRKVPKTAKPPTAPNIWIKHEDLSRLAKWEKEFRTNILVVHLFDQEAFCVDLAEIHTFDRKFDKATDKVLLQLESGIFRFSQTYDRVDAQGARETKLVFVVSPCAATKVGDVRGVKVGAQHGLSASKKYVAHVIFSGGSITLSRDFLQKLCVK